MIRPTNLLILGGTGEAWQLAERLADEPQLRVTTSLAGRTADPIRPRGQIRTGGFGGAEGLERYLAEQRIDAVIDATHPFASIISANAVAACGALGMPRLALKRDPWRRIAGDRWIEAVDLAAAAAAAIGFAKRIFLTVGRRELDAFATANDVWFLVRLVDRPDRPLPLHEHAVITGRGPFTVGDERRVLAQHRIEAIVAKNSGGAATYPKIAAARDMGLPVVMVRPPTPPPGDRVATVTAALDWIRRRT